MPVFNKDMQRIRLPALAGKINMNRVRAWQSKSIITKTQRVEKTVAALVLNKARSGIWSRGLVARSLVTTRLSLPLPIPF